MIKKAILFIAKKLFKWALNVFWAYLDKDKNGAISKKEINSFIRDLKNLKEML